MNMMPRIQSVGPPPEKHADRVVAEMLRWIVKAHTNRILDQINEIREQRQTGTQAHKTSWLKSSKTSARLSFPLSG